MHQFVGWSHQLWKPFFLSRRTQILFDSSTKRPWKRWRELWLCRYGNASKTANDKTDAFQRTPRWRRVLMLLYSDTQLAVLGGWTRRLQKANYFSRVLCFDCRWVLGSHQFCWNYCHVSIKLASHCRVCVQLTVHVKKHPVRYLIHSIFWFDSRSMHVLW